MSLVKMLIGDEWIEKGLYTFHYNLDNVEVKKKSLYLLKKDKGCLYFV